MESKTVIRSYLVIAGIYTLSASLIWGVNTLFLLEAGLDIFDVFVANAVFTAGMVVFEIPTGVLADTAGRRVSFLLSVLVLAFGTLSYVGVAEMGGGLFWFCVASVILGLGFTFYSGAVEAWLVDALHATDYDGELDHVFARGSQITSAMMLIGTVSGGLLGNVDLALPFVGRASLLIAVFGFAWFYMHDIGFETRAMHARQIPVEMRKIARESITYGWQVRPVRLLMLVGFFQSAFFMWGWYAWQPYFLNDLLGRPDAVWIAGVVAALVACSMILGNSFVDWITRYCGKRTTIVIGAAAVMSVAVIMVGVVNNFYLAAGFYLISTTAFGVFGPVRQAYMHGVIPSAQRASVVSFDSMVGSSGGVGGQFGLGYLSRAEGVGPGYIVGGALTLVAVPILYLLRLQDHEADIIVGKAGHQAACAGQGIPAVAQHDARPRRAYIVHLRQSISQMFSQEDLADETPSDS